MNKISMLALIRAIFSKEGLLILLQKKQLIEDFTSFNQLPLTRPLHTDTVRKLRDIQTEIQTERKNLDIFNRQRGYEHMLSRHSTHYNPMKRGFYGKLPIRQHREFERCKINAILTAHIEFHGEYELPSHTRCVIQGFANKIKHDVRSSQASDYHDTFSTT